MVCYAVNLTFTFTVCLMLSVNSGYTTSEDRISGVEGTKDVGGGSRSLICCKLNGCHPVV